MRILESKPSYDVLEAQVEIARERIADLEDNERFICRELNYLYSFITWKNLSEEFAYFEKNAHEKCDDDLPFLTMTL